MRANKSLGQNFLVNELYIKQIIQAANVTPEDTIVEIGGGLGALTRYLITTLAKKIIVVEKDQRFIALLQALPSEVLEIIEGDALKIKIPSDEKVKIVANLPYNISTELLFGWFEELDKIKSMTLMFQKEVALRVCANAGDRNYGKISVIADILCKRHLLFDIPPEAFDPAPKVTSAVAHLIPREKPLYGVNLKEFSWFLDNIFSQRRKTIKNGMKTVISNGIAKHELNAEDILNKAEIKVSERAENLTTKQLVNLFIVFCSFQ